MLEMNGDAKRIVFFNLTSNSLGNLSGRSSGPRRVLLLHKKMLPEAAIQGWEEGHEGRGGPQVRAALRQHVQGQGTPFPVPCTNIDISRLIYKRGIGFDMFRYSRTWRSSPTMPRNPTKATASKLKSNSESFNTK